MSTSLRTEEGRTCLYRRRIHEDADPCTLARRFCRGRFGADDSASAGRRQENQAGNGQEGDRGRLQAVGPGGGRRLREGRSGEGLAEGPCGQGSQAKGRQGERGLQAGRNGIRRRLGEGRSRYDAESASPQDGRAPEDAREGCEAVASPVAAGARALVTSRAATL